MPKIIVNPDALLVNEIRKRVRENDGYCPCKIEKIEENKCPCHEFLYGTDLGECHCGLYIKKEK